MAGTLFNTLWSKQVRVLLRLGGAFRPFYRLCFLAGGARHGVFKAMVDGPQTAEALASSLGMPPEHVAGLQGWLDFGCRLREIRRDTEGMYSLRGALAKRLARPENDGAAAFIEEIVTLHHLLLLETPGRLIRGEPFTLADQDGEIIARSSRTIEPLIVGALERALPLSGPTRLLEVGCGSGIYIRHAAAANSSLTALGLELQPEVAEQARTNLEAWGLAERATVEVGDVRDREPEPVFDVVTLHNNIYYFPTEERTALFEHLGGFLRSGGTLLVTTGCRGGNLGFELLDLWGKVTEGCGPLPRPDELVDQIRDAGLQPDTPNRVIPGDTFYSFAAHKL